MNWQLQIWGAKIRRRQDAIVEVLSLRHGLEITTSLPSENAELEVLQRLGVRRVLVPLSGGGCLNPPIRDPEDLAWWTETINRHADA